MSDNNEVLLLKLRHSSCCGIQVVAPVVGLQVTEKDDYGDPVDNNFSTELIDWGRFNEADWLAYNGELEYFFGAGPPQVGMMELRFTPLDLPIAEGFEELSCSDKGRLIGRVV